MKLGDQVNLIRKITNEILPVTLDRILTDGTAPMVEVYWKSNRHRYKLDLTRNLVLAIDATQDHRQSMRVWYTISEAHRKDLTELFWNTKKRGRRSDA